MTELCYQFIRRCNTAEKLFLPKVEQLLKDAKDRNDIPFFMKLTNLYGNIPGFDVNVLEDFLIYYFINSPKDEGLE